MFKVIAIVILTAAVAVGGTVFWQHMHPPLMFDPTANGTAVVQRGQIVQAVASTGTVASNLDVQIKCQASGNVLQLGPKGRTKQFDVSDTVQKGDLLMQIDPTDELRAQEQAAAQVAISTAKLEEAKQKLVVAQQTLDQAKETAYADLASAQAQYVDAQSQADRRKELLAQKLDTQEDYDSKADQAAQMKSLVDDKKVAVENLKTQECQLQVTAQDVKLAAAQLQSDQVGLDEANQQLGYCTIDAPMDGVITTLNVEEGTIISSATSVVGGAAVMVLSDLSKIFILADVDESEIGGVKPNQEVEIKADAFPNVVFKGTVVRIAAEGVNVSNVVTFEVKIEVTSDNKELLKPEMTADVNIVQSRKNDVLLVPVTAIERKDRKQVVTVQKKDGTTEEREVTVGLSDGINDEVLSGLNLGDTVVLHRSASESRWNGGQPNRAGNSSSSSGSRRS